MVRRSANPAPNYWAVDSLSKFGAGAVDGFADLKAYISNISDTYMANKMDLIDKVHSAISCTKADAERAVEAIISSITDSLKRGEEVSVAGLGIFEAKTRGARTGRNPRTGETIQIKAMRVPKFRASKTLKDAVK